MVRVFVAGVFEPGDVAGGGDWACRVRALFPDDECPELIAAVSAPAMDALRAAVGNDCRIVAGPPWRADAEGKAAVRALLRVRVLRCLEAGDIVWFVDGSARPYACLPKCPGVGDTVGRGGVVFLPFWEKCAGSPAVRGTVVRVPHGLVSIDRPPRAAEGRLISVAGGDLGCAVGRVAAFACASMAPDRICSKVRWMCGDKPVAAAKGNDIVSESVGWCRGAAGRVRLTAWIECPRDEVQSSNELPESFVRNDRSSS